MRIPRRATLGAALASAFAPALRAQPAWPSGPVRIVAPFPPGGSTDALARLLQPHLQQSLGVPIVVENRAGASGAIGTAAVARSAPDGNSWVLVFDTHAVNPALIPNLGFDTERDLTPLLLFGTAPIPLAQTGAARSPSMPDLPTLAESGVPGIDARAFWGFLGPAGLPPPVKMRMEAAIRGALAQPELRARVTGLGIDLDPQGEEGFARFLSAQIATWGRVVRENNIRPD